MTIHFLLRLIETYYRHRWLYLIPIVFTAGAAAYYFFNLEPKYSTNGILYVNNPSLLTSLTAIPNNNTNWWITPAQATSTEINELLQTDAFVRAIIKDTDLEEYMAGGSQLVEETISSVRKSFWVSPVGNNELYINVTYDNPDVAYQLLNSMINSYIHWHINTKALNSQVAIDFFTDLINTLSIELDNARQNLKDYYEVYPQPIRGDRPIAQLLEIERLQNEIATAASRYQEALNNHESANLALKQVESDVRHTYILLDAPFVPEKPDLSKRKIAIQLAQFIGAGVLLSIIGIAGSALLDRSLRFPVDVLNRLSLTVLAVVPDPTPRLAWHQRLPLVFKKNQRAEVETESLHLADTSFPTFERLNQEAEEHVDISI